MCVLQPHVRHGRRRHGRRRQIHELHVGLGQAECHITFQQRPSLLRAQDQLHIDIGGLEHVLVRIGDILTTEREPVVGAPFGQQVEETRQLQRSVAVHRPTGETGQLRMGPGTLLGTKLDTSGREAIPRFHIEQGQLQVFHLHLAGEPGVRRQRIRRHIQSHRTDQRLELWHLVQQGQQLDALGARAHGQLVPLRPDVDRRGRGRHQQAVLHGGHPRDAAVPRPGAAEGTGRHLTEQIECHPRAGIESQCLEGPRQVCLQRQLPRRQRHTARDGFFQDEQVEILDADPQAAPVTDESTVDVDRPCCLEGVGVTLEHLHRQVEALEFRLIPGQLRPRRFGQAQAHPVTV